jgi:hypothetical protein
VNLEKESPWGYLWIEWHLHNKAMTFDAAAKLEMQLASDILQVATSVENQHFIHNNQTATGLIVTKKPEPEHDVIKHNTDPLPDHWAEEIAKREAINRESPSRQSSDDDSVAHAMDNLRLRSGTSPSFSGGFSNIGSTNGSMTTNEGDNTAIPQWNPIENYSGRHQHSQSLSAIAPTGSFNHNPKARRGGSISIPSTAASFFGFDSDPTKDVGINVGTLMSRHGIWSTPPSGLTPWSLPGKSSATSGETDGLTRSRRGSRHISNPSVTSQQCGLTVVSEDEEDVFNKHTPKNS